MVEFILANLPVLVCFLLGLVLLIVEAFMPGFGLPGISGIVLEIAAIMLTYTAHGGLAALGMTLMILAAVALAISLALHSINHGRLSRSPVVLNDAERTEDGYVAVQDLDVFLGKEGITTTVLRPTGMAEFDGVKLNVQSDGEYIAREVPVRVERIEGVRVVVRRITGA